MRNFFKSMVACLMLTSMCLSFYSCQEKPDIPEAPEIKPTELNLLSEDSIAADPAGGNYTIEYEIVNPIEGVQVTAAAVEGSDWIVNIDCTAAGRVSFNVVENTTDDPRSEIIVVSYNDTLSFEVEIAQESNIYYDVREDALDIHGRYFGYQSSYGTYNFMLWLALAEDAFDEDTNNCNKETDYYRLDLYSQEFEDASTQYITNMPTGTYKLDTENTYGLFTLASNYCSLDEYYLDEWGRFDYDRQQFTAGELTIEESEAGYLLILKVTTEDGRAHHIKYNGEVTITNMVL